LTGHSAQYFYGWAFFMEYRQQGSIGQDAGIQLRCTIARSVRSNDKYDLRRRQALKSFKIRDPVCPFFDQVGDTVGTSYWLDTL
jgi:hypothetical protein